MMKKSGRFTNLPERLRKTTEAMASQCVVDFGLWDVHSNVALDSALKIEALERDAAHIAATKDAEITRLRDALESLSHIHDGNPSDATADTPPLDYARHMLWEARRLAREALEAKP